METESINLQNGKKKRKEQTKRRISGKSYVKNVYFTFKFIIMLISLCYFEQLSF